uniref:Unspecific monooxygenase n=1 Tax=Davidia involucrata TaxID=16924 RepID=A0A5B7A324_DAVIN
MLQGWYHYSRLTDLLGDGIFTVDGEKWRHQRKTSSYEFSTKMLRDFSSVVFRSIAEKLAQLVSEAASSNQTIEIQVRYNQYNYHKYHHSNLLDKSLTCV